MTCLDPRWARRSVRPWRFPVLALWLIALVAGALAGCPSEPGQNEPDTRVDPPSDLRAPDRGVDGTADARVDSVADRFAEHVFDLPADMGPDAAPDLGPDAAPDLGLDVAPDLSVDAAVDVGTDGPPADAGPWPTGVSTLAGSGTSGAADGFREAAEFFNPVNVAVGPDGNIYVTDFENYLVRKVTPQGMVTTVLTGPSTFQRPFGMVFANDGKLYVETDYDAQGLEQKNGALWTIDLQTGVATLVLDQCGRLRGLAALPAPDDRLVAADFIAHVVQLFDPQTKSLTVLAGAKDQPGYVNGTGSAARFSEPYDVVVTASGEIIVADKGNHRLRKVTLAGVVTPWAGDGTAATLDGTLLGARFNTPQALAIAGGTVYVTETVGYVIRKIAGGQVTTIAGTGTAGFLDHTDPRQAQFFGLEGMDVTPDGAVLYVADGDQGEALPYHRIRRIALP